MKPFVFVIILFFVSQSLWAQEESTEICVEDTVSIAQKEKKHSLSELKEKAEEFFYNENNDYKFHYGQVVIPAVLVSVGAFGVENGWMRKQKESYKELMEKLCNGHKTEIDDYMQYAPAAAYLGLPALGVKGKHPYREKIATAATAYLMMATMVNGLKYTVKEKRPDTNRRNSFPSGHTATAFCGAELVHIEYGGWYGVGAYLAAFGVGFCRPYNSRHYLNDVIAGAGIGILSARMAYWLLPIEKRLLGWDNDKRTQITVVPYYSFGTNRGMGASMAVIF